MTEAGGLDKRPRELLNLSVSSNRVQICRERGGRCSILYWHVGAMWGNARSFPLACGTPEGGDQMGQRLTQPSGTTSRRSFLLAVGAGAVGKGSWCGAGTDCGED